MPQSAESQSTEKRAYTTIREAVKSTDDKEYNENFSMLELNNASAVLKPSCAGPDDIHPLMLKNLGENGRVYLLNIINRRWNENRVPSARRTALIAPIL